MDCYYLNQIMIPVIATVPDVILLLEETKTEPPTEPFSKGDMSPMGMAAGLLCSLWWEHLFSLNQAISVFSFSAYEVYAKITNHRFMEWLIHCHSNPHSITSAEGSLCIEMNKAKGLCS